MDQAETGDLLLFRGSHFSGKMTRGFTKGDADHCGIVMRFDKFSKGVIFFLESVTDRGVCFSKWDEFLKNNSIYEQIFFRKLTCVRDKAFYDKFEEFLDKVQGNDYQLNFQKLLFSRKSVNLGEGDLKLEKRRFFCSELIIKCYKEMGLLKTDNASCSYTPASLSCMAKHPIKLENASLGEDQIIIIS